MNSSDAFDTAKRAMLHSLQSGIDFSPKGSIDKPCLSCVEFINDHLDDYVTTSSCSGRISVNRDEGTGKGVSWLLVEHGPVTVNLVRKAIIAQTPLPKGYGVENHDKNSFVVDNRGPAIDEPSDCKVNDVGMVNDALVNLNCEGFILHVRCRDISSGRRLHAIALAAGFRESGLTLSAKRVMLAVRSFSYSLEMPIARGSRLLLGDELLELVVAEANQRLRNNFLRINRFVQMMKESFGWPKLSLRPLRASARQPEVRRFGHCCVAESLSGNILCLGGQGTPGPRDAPVTRRGLPSLRLMRDGSDNKEPVVLELDLMSASACDSVHAAALPEVWDAGCIHLVVLSGGRRSPLDALAPLRILQVHDSKLSNVPIQTSGTIPLPRWGHILVPLDHCVDSGMQASSSVRHLLLYGGRDSSQVFDDAYIATLYLIRSEDTTSNGSCCCHCHWQRVLDLPMGSRFFHAAATVWSTHEPVENNAHFPLAHNADECNYVLLSTLAVHGGLNSLDGSPMQVRRDMWAISVRISVPATSNALNDMDRDVDCSVEAYPLCDNNLIPRFAHSLVPIGASTLLLTGGCTSGSGNDEENSACQLSFDPEQEIETVDDCAAIATAQKNFPGVVAFHCVQQSGSSARPGRFSVRVAPTSFPTSAGESVALEEVAEDVRCHHSAVVCRRRGEPGSVPVTSLHSIGGGVHVLAFGPKFCDSLCIHLGCETSNTDMRIGEEEMESKTVQQIQPSPAVLPPAAALPAVSPRAIMSIPADIVCVLVVPASCAKRVKTFLEHHQWLCKKTRISPLSGLAARLAREIYDGDITTDEEIRSASKALALRNMTETSHVHGESIKFLQLAWLGLQPSSYTAILPITAADWADPLAKKPTRKEKKGKPVSEQNETIAEGEAQSHHDNPELSLFMAIPVQAAFTQWLAQRSLSVVGARSSGNAVQERIAADICQRLGRPYAPLFSFRPVARNQNPSLQTADSPAPRLRPDERAYEVLRLMTQEEATAHCFSDAIAACSMGGKALPRKWEMVGDVLMLPEGALTGHGWELALPAPPAPAYSSEDTTALVSNDIGSAQALAAAKAAEVAWRRIAECFGPHVSRVARRSKVDSGPKRESHILLLLPAIGRPPLPPPCCPGKPLTSTSLLDTQKADVGMSVNVQRLAATGGTLTDILPYSAGWVSITENGIRFSFDITRVMFCSGNVTERMRMARMQCQGQTIVDLYAGVGYYTLPFLVYGGAKHVHALEWNPFSVASLRHNLRQAGIDATRCTIYEGDNRITLLGESSRSPTFPSPHAHNVAPMPPQAVVSTSDGDALAVLERREAVCAMSGIADRVCCGLLPSSSEGWPLAVLVLNKQRGGIIHVHENIHEDLLPLWAHNTLCAKFIELFEGADGLPVGHRMDVKCIHIERVKSYAPRVLHIVADLQCIPVPTNK